MSYYWNLAEMVIRKTDIIVLVVDARMPELSKNEILESAINKHKKKMVLAFNKIDLLSESSLRELRRVHPYAFFVSGVRNIGMAKLKTGLLILAKRMGIEEPRIGIVGYPNVGKSAVINALAKRARAKVARKAGTTRGIQWVRAGGLSILDTPGVVPMKDGDIKLGFIGAKDPEKVRGREKLSIRILSYLIETNKSAAEKFYGVELNGDEEDILDSIGKKRGFLLKGGKIDRNRTIMQIIRDWQTGKLKV